MSKAAVSRLFGAAVVAVVAGLVIAIVAVVAAFAGGAIAIGGPKVVSVDGQAFAGRSAPLSSHRWSSAPIQDVVRRPPRPRPRQPRMGRDDRLRDRRPGRRGARGRQPWTGGGRRPLTGAALASSDTTERRRSRRLRERAGIRGSKLVASPDLGVGMADQRAHGGQAGKCASRGRHRAHRSV